jgi:phospholipase C
VLGVTESAGARPRRERIEHVVVLMLENRSFDHLLGYLDHPDPRYPNLDELKPSCPVHPDQPNGPAVPTTPDADTTLGVDPDHSPEAVREQIFGSTEPDAGAPPTMGGFVRSYARQLDGDSPHEPNPVLAILTMAWRWLSALLGPSVVRPAGADIMRCFSPTAAPVLTALAKHYAVLVNWYASVPGETWPNRNFAHAATSHGTTEIVLRFYDDPTIFDLLGDDGWRVYHQGVPQVWAFPATWITERRRDNFRDTGRLFADIAKGDLPKYTFVEPDHGFGPGEGNSQHPGNNTTSDESFRAGEALIARIYTALAAKEELFARTLFLVTYDEHGGFFDHEPPVALPRPDDLTAPDGFDFSTSGVRVPAVAISPLIPKGWLETRRFDHASIPRTVRAQFGLGADWLTRRDETATDLLADLPLLEDPREDPLTFDMNIPAGVARADVPAAKHLNDFQASLVDLAGAVHNVLDTPGPEVLAAANGGPPPYQPTATLAAAAQHRRLDPDSPASQAIAEVLARFTASPGADG